MLVVPEYAKYPPFQAVLDVPDMTAGGFCRAPTDGGQASCGPGAIAFQLQSHTCLDNFATELTAVLAEITEALSDADSFEDMVEGFRRFGSSTFEVFSRCSPRLPETVYVRHALEPWSTEVAAARFNPFICHAGTFFLNPFCRATGLNEIYAVDYDHQSSFDDFDLTIDVDFAQTRGQLVSNSGEVIDWVTVKVPAGAKFGANVDLAGIWEVTEQDEEWGLDLFIESAQWADTFSASDVEFMGSGSRTRPVPRYRLIVVGSTDQTQASDVRLRWLVSARAVEFSVKAQRHRYRSVGASWRTPGSVGRRRLIGRGERLRPDRLSVVRHRDRHRCRGGGETDAPERVLFRSEGATRLADLNVVAIAGQRPLATLRQGQRSRARRRGPIGFDRERVAPLRPCRRRGDVDDQSIVVPDLRTGLHAIRAPITGSAVGLRGASDREQQQPNRGAMHDRTLREDARRVC